MTEDDMTAREVLTAVLRFAFGTDAEMAHPKMQEEAEQVLSTTHGKMVDVPKTREETQAKINEAHASIDQMRQSTDRLARLQPARNLDEAMRQITGA